VRRNLITVIVDLSQSILPLIATTSKSITSADAAQQIHAGWSGVCGCH
jgi:hypothetical protein